MARSIMTPINWQPLASDLFSQTGLQAETPSIAGADNGLGPSSVPKWFPGSAVYNNVSNATPLAWPSGMLATLAGGIAADIYEYGLPIYMANSMTPRYSVTVTTGWSSSFHDHLVPIPTGAQPATGSDAGLVVVDTDTNYAYEFWQAKYSNGVWSTSSGDIISVLGRNISSDIEGYGCVTGSNIAPLAGIVTVAELQAGAINHALVCSSSITSTSFIAPATKSDGTHTGASYLPEGSLLRLDPSVNLGAIAGITPFELMVGKALQTFGVYVRDSGGSPLAFGFQAPRGVDPYPSLGVPWDYWNMPHIPWATALQLIAG